MTRKRTARRAPEHFRENPHTHEPAENIPEDSGGLKFLKTPQRCARKGAHVFHAAALPIEGRTGLYAWACAVAGCPIAQVRRVGQAAPAAYLRVNGLQHKAPKLRSWIDWQGEFVEDGFARPFPRPPAAR